MCYHLMVMKNLARREERTGTRVVEKPVDEETRALLVQRMRHLREQIEQSGVPLLDWDDLEREIKERRGERDL